MIYVILALLAILYWVCMYNNYMYDYYYFDNIVIYEERNIEIVIEGNQFFGNVGEILIDSSPKA